MDVITQFRKNVFDSGLINKNESVLIACSGGPDSTALAYMLSELDVTFSLAYFNHNTRNGESKADGEFVKSLALKLKVHYFTFDLAQSKIQFPTLNDTNFQASARNHRYHFFLNRIREKEKYDWIATGHHMNDSLETFIFNLSRKSGPEKLTGISKKRGFIVRPFYWITKNQLLSYLVKNNLEFIRDKSNDDLKYKRNYIRHKIIPELLNYESDFIQSADCTFKFIDEQNRFVQNEILNWTKSNLSYEGNRLKIKLSALESHHNPSFILFHILKSYGFNRQQVKDIFEAKSTGKQIHSKTHLCTKSYDFLIIDEINRKNNVELTYNISNEKPEGHDFIELSATINQEKLCIRKWQPGDFMRFNYGKKKVKKIFSEQKIDIVRKHEYFLLAHDSEVLWIINLLKGIQGKSGIYLYLKH